MKKILVFAGSLMAPLTSLAAEIGISGAMGTTAEFRVPIKTKTMIFEPYFSYYLSDSSQENDADDKYKQAGLGIGIWKKIDLSENMYSQFGAQLGYVSGSQEGGYISQRDEGVSGNQYTEESDGYLFAPGFGLFYQVQENFDVGIEVKYRYESLSGTREELTAGYPDYSWETLPSVEIKETNSWVQTQAVLRMYF